MTTSPWLISVCSSAAFRLAKLGGIRFSERPIRYAPRTYKQGKKIGWRDALWALWCVLRY